MNELLKAWDPSGLLDELLDQGGGGVPEVARAFTVAGLASRTPVLLVVLPRSRDAEGFTEALKVWMDPGDVALFPAWEVVPGEAMSPTLQTMGRRVKLLRDLAAGRPPKVIVTPVRALVQAVAEPPPAPSI